MNSVTSSIATRTCGTCTLCCRLPEIDELSKPADTRCTYCTEGLGCTIYQTRPGLCRDFLCRWITDDWLDPAWNPASSHMMIYEQGPQLTILVDPDFPELWTIEPYASDLKRWAADASARDGYVIVFVGEAVYKIG